MIELLKFVTVLFLFSFWGALWIYDLCFLILHITQRCLEITKYFCITMLLSSLWPQKIHLCWQFLVHIFLFVTESWIFQLFYIPLEDHGVNFAFKFYSSFRNKRAWMHNIFWLCLTGHTASMTSWILTFIFNWVFFFFSLNRESMTLLPLTATGGHLCLSPRWNLFVLRAEGLVNFVWGNNINKISREWPQEESENYTLVKREHVAAEKQCGQLKSYQPLIISLILFD